MRLSELVGPSRAIPCLKGTTKRALVDELARLASSELNQPQARIAEALNARERLGSTGIGGGVALPHAVIDGLDQPLVLLVTLDRGIDFQSVDEQPVDVICLLLSPTTGRAHNESLACIARALRNKSLLDRARSARTAAQLHAAICAEP